MQTRRKLDQCLNCGHPLEHQENYCPVCGQANREVKIGFGQLVLEFLGNYLALDSRIGRSIVPFLSQPGFLTMEFNKGKRKKYVHPVRLYLAMSIFYFFVLSLAINSLAPKDEAIINIEIDGLEFFDLLDEESTGILRNRLSERSIEKLEDLDNLENQNLKEVLLNTISEEETDQLEIIFGAQLKHLNLSSDHLAQRDSIKGDLGSGPELHLDAGVIDFGQLDNLKNDLGLSDQEVVDSITTGALSTFENRMALQLVKLSRSRKDAILQIIVNNFPVMMLLLIPLFAGILKLLFLKSGRLYIEHVIHALHLHAFAYFSFGVFLLILFIPAVEANWGEQVATLGFVLVAGYAFRSFKKIYQGNWARMLIKFLSVGFIYVLAICFFLVVEVLISLYLF